MSENCLSSPEIRKIATRLGETYCELYNTIHQKHTSATERNYVLIVHGLGGCVDQWKHSHLAEEIASQGHYVCTFDWYNHGKSTRINDFEDLASNPIDVYKNQLEDVINHEDFPINGFCFDLHAFSMGCFIAVNFIADGTRLATKRIKKLILQSPWNGSIPSFQRYLLQLPLIASVVRHCFFSGCQDTSTFHTLVTRLGPEYDNWDNTVVCFAAALLHSTTFTELLIIAGSVEIPFRDNAIFMFDSVSRHLPLQTFIKVCDGAHHMSFLEDRENNVGKEVHCAIINFYAGESKNTC